MPRSKTVPPQPGEPEWWFAPDPLRKSYGLVTVLTAPETGQRRTLLFAGINSDGTEAGARFLTSPAHLEDLDRRFQQAGHSAWPARSQMVVRSDSDEAITIEAQFEFLRILK